MTASRSAAFDSAFRQIDFGSRHAVVAAISGGSDSTALVLALHRWIGRHLPSIRIVAVTVDHGIRTESAAEAREVARFCAGLGMEHRTLRWESASRGAGLSARAREARYRLLAGAADEIGTDLVLTGHTSDDQAETVYMRKARGGSAGLAGMAVATLFDGHVWIVRPLLALGRAGLRVFLENEGAGWIEDPSNDNVGYERVRARRALAGTGLTEGLLEIARNAAVERAKLSGLAARRIDDGAAPAAPGLVRLSPFFASGEDEAVETLRILLACTGGREFLPGADETRRLQSRLKEGRTALSRTLVTPSRGSIYLHREARGLPLQDVGGIYDRRYRIARTFAAGGWRLVRRTIPVAEPATERLTALEGAALAAEPVLRPPEHTGEAEKGELPEIRRYLAPFDHFLSAFDLPAAQACARLYGRARFPCPPVRELP